MFIKNTQPGYNSVILAIHVTHSKNTQISKLFSLESTGFSGFRNLVYSEVNILNGVWGTRDVAPDRYREPRKITVLYKKGKSLDKIILL